jgi:hypothetical protein
MRAIRVAAVPFVSTPGLNRSRALSMYLPFLQITEFLQIRVNRLNDWVSLEPRVSDNDGESLCDRHRSGQVR